MTHVQTTGLRAAVDQLTPVLQIWGQANQATVSDLFNFLDAPFGHPVLFDGCRCFYYPVLLYFRAETRCGLFQVESFEGHDYLIDYIEHVLALYPGIRDLSLRDVSPDSFIAVRWTRIYPDAADADIVIYFSLYCDCAEYYARKIKMYEPFNLEIPQNYFYCIKDDFSLLQCLAASAALRMQAGQLHGSQDMFDLLSRYGRTYPHSVDPEELKMLVLDGTELNNTTQFLLNMLHIRMLRRRIRQYYKSEVGESRQLQMSLLFPQNASQNDLLTTTYLQELDFAIIGDALIDCFRNTFRADSEVSADSMLDARFLGIGRQPLQHRRQIPCCYLVQLSQISETEALTLLEPLIIAAVDQFIRGIPSEQTRANSYLCLKHSTSSKKRALEAVRLRWEDFFTVANPILDSDDAFDETDLAVLCYERFLPRQLKGTARLAEIGHFLTGDGAFEDQKERIRQRIGQLHGFEITVRVEIRPGSKKWGLKTVE